jgi:hypothetical protein
MTSRPELWEDAFLAALRRTTGNFRTAADLAGIHRAQVYRRMRRSGTFASRVRSLLTELRQTRTRRATAAPLAAHLR